MLGKKISTQGTICNNDTITIVYWTRSVSPYWYVWFSKNNQRKIALLMTDTLTKYVKVIAIENKEAEAVAEDL
jgi:hypothetical protein